MPTLPPAFTKLLESTSLATQQRMFQYLNDSIVAKLNVIKEEKLSKKIARIKKAAPQKTSPPTADSRTTKELLALAEHIPALLGFDDDLYTATISELKSMKLVHNSNKVFTKWLSPSSDSYNYGTVVNKPFPISNYPSISKLMEIINIHPSTSGDMDSCLVSRFEDHKVNLKLHKDNEVLISQTSSICTVSLGAPRSLELVLDGKRNSWTDKSLPATDRTVNIMKPGCQAVMKHRVPPGKPSAIGETAWRYSLSFRKLAVPTISTTFPAVPAPSHPPHPSPHQAPLKEEHPKQPKKSINLIAGDSFLARLDASRLGRDKEEVVNIAKGGAKITAIQHSLEEFASNNPSVHVKKLFLSFGANDIRYCKLTIRHLKNAVGDLLKMSKKLFPGAKIFVQSIPPVHPNGLDHIPMNVINMNNLIFDRCSRYKIFYVDVFWAFIDRNGNRNDRLFPRYDPIKNFYDIHPSPKAGMPVLARFYLRLIHSKWFNPLGY